MPDPRNASQSKRLARGQDSKVSKVRKVTAGPKRGTAPKASSPPRLSRTRRPAELPVADWQAALRQQFGREQEFGLDNLGIAGVLRIPRPQPGQWHELPGGHSGPRGG